MSIDKCRDVVGDETEDRAFRIGTACTACVCEQLSVGRHGSPGPVISAEALHSVIISPGDLAGDQINFVVLSHAEKKGMSVMRDRASNDELRKILDMRTAMKAGRNFHGVASIFCRDLRGLVSSVETQDRKIGERLYSVLDTDLPDLPSHADVFVTVPSKNPEKALKNEHRVFRERLLEMMEKNFIPAYKFRDGALSQAP